VEDKAVDLHLLKQALASKHHRQFEECFSAVMEGYKAEIKDFPEIEKRLKKVEERGRYKEKSGN
jgi:tRNA A-37 threonylcarbamoyl transferase component Bud32